MRTWCSGTRIPAKPSSRASGSVRPTGADRVRAALTALALLAPAAAGASSAGPGAAAGDSLATAPADSAAHAPAAPAPSAADSVPPVPRRGIVGGTVVSDPGAEGLPIRRIVVLPRDLYDPVPPGRLAAFYRLANTLHIRTRPSTVENQLLFHPGDRWSRSLGLETVRHLRALAFLTPLRIRAVRVGDSVDVDVQTRDIWSTTPEFNLESAGGRQYGAVAFTERNLLGFGKYLSFVVRHDPVSGVSREFGYDDPSVRGSHLRLHFGARGGGEGAGNELSFGIPFYSERILRSYGFSWERTTDVVRLYHRAAEAAVVDRRSELSEVWWGHASWRDSIVQRWTYSFFAREHRLGESMLRPGAPADFAGDEESFRIRRLATEFRVWRPHFVERVGVDQIGVVEDFDLGASMSMKLGVSPRALGSTADEGFMRVRLDAGLETPWGFGRVRTSVQGRLRENPREVLKEVDARWVVQPIHSHALVLAALGRSGGRTPRDYQAVIGGLNGLRAYPLHAVAGTRVWRVNAEHRWILFQNLAELLSAGAVVFTDAARAWGTGVADTEWFTDVGVGMRFSSPHSSPGKILRFDVAWPVHPTRDGRRDPVFSFGSSQAF